MAHTMWLPTKEEEAETLKGNLGSPGQEIKSSNRPQSNWAFRQARHPSSMTVNEEDSHFVILVALGGHG